MIKLIISTITLLLSLALTAQTQSKPSSVNASFGRHGDCSGRGACSFGVNKTATSSLEKLAAKVTENTIVLTLNRTAVSQSDELKIAGKLLNDLKINDEVTFVQLDNLIIDATTLQSLNINAKFNKIAPGNYPMIIDKDKIEIVFTLRTSN